MSEAAAMLTYHRLTNDMVRFYDVAWPTFERHVQLIAGRAIDVDGPWIRLDNGRSLAITFDDGTADHAVAAEILGRHGLVGVFFIVSGWIDTEGFVSSDDVRSMAGAGHRIGSHSANHRLLPKLTDDDLVGELAASKSALQSLTNQAIEWLAPPGGAYDERVLEAAAAAGYEVVRTMEWGYCPEIPTGRTSCLPVFRGYDEPKMTRLIDGRAPMWRYRAKTTVKRLLPDGAYHRLRALSASGRR